MELAPLGWVDYSPGPVTGFQPGGDLAGFAISRWCYDQRQRLFTPSIQLFQEARPRDEALGDAGFVKLGLDEGERICIC
jgi:hypothetical protein